MSFKWNSFFNVGRINSQEDQGDQSFRGDHLYQEHPTKINKEMRVKFNFVVVVREHHCMINIQWVLQIPGVQVVLVARALPAGQKYHGLFIC